MALLKDNTMSFAVANALSFNKLHSLCYPNASPSSLALPFHVASPTTFPRFHSLKLGSSTKLSPNLLVSRRKEKLDKPSLCVRCFQKLSDVISVPLSDDTNGLTTIPAAPGIYAIYDKVGELQFIGLSRRVASSVQSHVQDLPELCGAAKVAVIDAPEREALVSAWKQWMEEYIDLAGKAPPGNISGVTTWTARKAKRTKPDLRLTPGRNKELTITLEELIDKVVKEHKIVAFIKGSRTAPACGFSHRVLTVLNEQGVEYETVNVQDEEHNAGVREALKAYSQWPTFPQVYVCGELLGGADIIDQMVQNGSIKALFQNSS